MTLETASIDTLYDAYYHVETRDELLDVVEQFVSRVGVQVGDYSIDFSLGGSRISTPTRGFGDVAATQVADFLFTHMARPHRHRLIAPLLVERVTKVREA